MVCFSTPIVSGIYSFLLFFFSFGLLNSTQNRFLTQPKKYIYIDTKYLVGFTCGHVFHLACLLQYEKMRREDLPESIAQMAAGEPPVGEFERSIGPKVDRAALLGTQIGEGCPVAVHKNGY